MRRTRSNVSSQARWLTTAAILLHCLAAIAAGVKSAAIALWLAGILKEATSPRWLAWSFGLSSVPAVFAAIGSAVFGFLTIVAFLLAALIALWARSAWRGSRVALKLAWIVSPPVSLLAGLSVSGGAGLVAWIELLSGLLGIAGLAAHLVWRQAGP